MDPTWTKALRDSISEVFSTMFFMVPEENHELAGAPGKTSVGGWYAGWMTLTRDTRTMEVSVWCPAEVAKELAANFLTGGAAELAESEVLDCFGEMINMVAGGILTKVDPTGQWKMGLPQKKVLKGGNVAQLIEGKDHCELLEVDGQGLVSCVAAAGGF